MKCYPSFDRSLEFPKSKVGSMASAAFWLIWVAPRPTNTLSCPNTPTPHQADDSTSQYSGGARSCERGVCLAACARADLNRSLKAREFITVRSVLHHRVSGEHPQIIHMFVKICLAGSFVSSALWVACGRWVDARPKHRFCFWQSGAAMQLNG